ncbi:MAG: hypothetical protein KA712_01895 [Myxococcales bacterium]|nr:hypothetical protein [Myxococcales bacterium]
MKTLWVLSMSAVLSSALGGMAFAQEEANPATTESEDGASYKAKTVYDFDDDTVEGDLQRPDGELVSAIQNVKQDSLIEIRKDFIPEMLKSLEDI